MRRSSSTPSPSQMSRRLFLTAAGAVSLGAALSACGGGSDGGGSGSSTKPVGQADIDKAMKTPTELTFWTWVPGIEQEVALFEKKYPAIKVKVVNAGQGVQHYTKLRTAIKAGKGAPDVAQMEYQAIPTFTITDSLLDPYGASSLKDTFVDWTWGQVSGPEGEIWAIPQDTGPMGMLYRADIFDKHGIEPPKTWDDFAAAARRLHKADPDVYITNLAANEAAAWHGLLWQAGAKPYATSGKGNVSIDVDDAISKKLAAYWGGLAQEGVIGVEPDFTDAWFSALNRGKYATWITAAWGPVFLAGSAKSTAGTWRAAPLPQWDAAKPSSGNWGGSTSAVIKATKNPIAAAVFAQFLNSDPESAQLLNTKQSFFPATKRLLADPAFAGDAPAFYGGQKVNQVFARIGETVSRDFQWPPFLDQAVTDWTETVGTSLAKKKDSVAALDAWQTRLTTYAKAQGFTVQAP